MDKFKKAITNYIEKDENFALFIDGEWGTGKTHFFEYDYFFNEIDENNEDIQKNYNKSSYKKEYISVYGKHSLKQIQEIIVTKLLSHVGEEVINQNIKKGLNNIFKLLDIKYINNENITASIDDYLETKAINKIKKNLNQNGAEVVLIIDDIERLSSSINLKEFLGFIRNVLLDSFNCKVILVGNKNSINSAHQEGMTEHWEKVISRTLKFPSNLEVAKNILEDDLKTTYFERNEIQEIKEFICIYSLSKSESSVLNLRTLKLVIADFKNLYDQLEDSNKQKANIRMSLFTSLFILHNINRNNETKTEKEFYELSPFNVAPVIDTKETPKKYFKDNKVAKNYAYFSNELKKYILEGNLDIKEYQRQINDNFSEKKADEDPLNILREFYFYSEDEIQCQEEKAVRIINDSTYGFGYRLNLYMSLIILNNKEMLFLEDCDLQKLEEELLDSFEPQKTNNVGGEFITNLTHYDFSNNEQLREFKKALSEKLKMKQKESITSGGIYEKYIEAILKLDRKTIGKLESDYREVLYLDIYEKFNEDINNVKEKLLESNAQIIELNRYLRGKGVEHTTLGNVEKFKENINKISTKVNDKITKYNFNTLIETLDENIKLLD
ncbi:P-loop NTPase fold protein [Staphylococcus arlettae]|uniref:P-loop NTPase fold protein n=1 Tax=Staphylococcus arlettae TaxID=29378 RepID=UPI0028A355EE|nr:P-loop NTPase fold protein [Staphylococcus arlettae]MDT3894581.1 P-loop NTPase fold protein [Staphylococcus arlettae]